MELVNESSDCFVLCDVSSVRYPILHSSNGFQKLYGQGEGDWWDAVQTGRSERLYEAVDEELSCVQINDAMDFLEQQVRDAAATASDAVGAPLLMINEKSCGAVFTCEIRFVQKHHPTLGWSYLLGIHREVTAGLPVEEVLKSARSLHSYRRLCAQWALQMRNKPPKAATRCFDHYDETVLGAWRERMEKKLVDENACNKVKYRSAEVETLASVSTACSMSSIARKTEGKGTTRLTFEPCFHLGALARGEGTTETTETKTTTESGRSSGRSDSEDHDRNLFLEEAESNTDFPEALFCPALSALPFRFFLLDPKHPDLPIVLCSEGFSSDQEELLLSRFESVFLNARPSAKTKASATLPDLWSAARDGLFCEYPMSCELLVDADLQSKSGELVNCLITLKQVELDDEMFVAGVAHPRGLETNDQCFDRAVEVMASEFFFSAPMKRQTAADE